MTQIVLKYTKKPHIIRINELTGKIESTINNTDTLTAINLIDQLLLPNPVNGEQPASALELTAADRDRILAGIYMQTYAEQITTDIPCRFCGKSFEVNFSLKDLVNNVYAEASENSSNTKGIFKLDNGLTFRLPTGRDELGLVNEQSDQSRTDMLKRCVIQSDSIYEAEEVEAAMERIAPALNAELDTICAECNKEQTIGFDIQTYLLESLRAERSRFHYEVHLIARVYRWGLEEIYSLPRRQRQAYVNLIEEELSG